MSAPTPGRISLAVDPARSPTHDGSAAEPLRNPAPEATPRSNAAALLAGSESPARVRIAVLGASGYAGQQLVRLALRHPGVELALLVTREGSGSLDQLVAGLDPRAVPKVPIVAMDDAAGAARHHGVELLACCLPHGVWREREPALAPLGARIVDLSSDHRAGSGDYIYGLPEAFRNEIAGARRVANPGCYPTAVATALLPALELGWVAGPIAVSAVSGVSGAGRGAALHTSFVERDGNAAIYRAGAEHAHVTEMERHLARVAGSEVRLSFVPVLAPMARGIVAVAHAPLARPVTSQEAAAAWAERYAGEPFVHVLPPGRWPETRAVHGGNRVDVAVTTLHGGRTLLAASALDNLIKGAAGQAIQNLNLMTGWPETTGLPRDGGW